jgi:uncharacterized lipoprotein YajG
MRTFRNRIAAATLAACALMVAACGPIASNPIALQYTPRNFLNPAAGAEGVAVRIVVNDRRTGRSLGNVEDHSGTPIAPIFATGNIADTLAHAISDGLATRGFNVVANAPVFVTVDLKHFDCQFQSSMLAASASARMVIDVTVARAGGPPVFSQRFSGSGTSTGFETASSENAKPALDRALSSAVNQVIVDPGFIAALESASRAPA